MKKDIAKTKKISDIPIAIFNVGDCVAMLSKKQQGVKEALYISMSSDGINFQPDSKKVTLNKKDKKQEKLSNCFNFSISGTPKGFVATYTREEKKNKKIIIALSKDGYEWNVKSELDLEDSKKATVFYNEKLLEFEIFRDGLFVRRQSSKNLLTWKGLPSLIFTSRGGRFDEEPIVIIGSLKTPRGVLVLYDASINHNNKILLQIGAVLLDKDDSSRILWRSDDPIVQSILETHKKGIHIKCIGGVVLNEKMNIYWLDGEGSIIVVSVPIFFRDVLIPYIKTSNILKRCVSNPIITPHPHNEWESEAVFNPAVFTDDEGVVHILYRAMGGDGISRVGYAQSIDGVSFAKRLNYPIFEPSLGFGRADSKMYRGPVAYTPGYYTSGGGWCGAEDPRVVKIEDTIYMIYVAFEGWHSVRIAITSISNQDFKRGHWKWKKPILISPPGEVHKNWVLFPEKIKGKYAILHGISPKILVDYIDDLDNFDDSKYIKSSPPKGGRDLHWDNKVRGAGPPPIRTRLGWLLLYHAMDRFDPNKYKLGAMILDIGNPTKVLYRSATPILSPDMHYENDGKPGVVYNSGAIIKGDDLYVYYGGGDKVICVATTKLEDLLDHLVNSPKETYNLKKVSEKML